MQLQIYKKIILESLNELNAATDTLLQNQKCTTNRIVDQLISIYLRHKISLVCLEDVVELLNINREICDQLPARKVQILKMFRDNKDVIEIYYFVKCVKCERIVKQNSESSDELKCCDVILSKDETNFFVYMPLRKQIIQSIEKNWDYIKKFDTSMSDNCVSDAHHGTVLKNLMKRYENEDINILSLCLNTDGVNKFKSNLVSLWPIQFTQNYLPPKIRFLPDNVLVCGLMYKEEKFDFREFFLPLVNELNNMSDDKITMEIEGQGYTFKPVVTHCTVDLPAKAKFQETKQYNGYDACTYCKHPGKQVLLTSTRKTKKNQSNSGKEPKETKGCRYTEGNESYPLRTEQEMLNNMLVASASASKTKDVNGVKGKILFPFTLCELHFD